MLIPITATLEPVIGIIPLFHREGDKLTFCLPFQLRKTFPIGEYGLKGRFFFHSSILALWNKRGQGSGHESFLNFWAVVRLLYPRVDLRGGFSIAVSQELAHSFLR